MSGIWNPNFIYIDTVHHPWVLRCDGNVVGWFSSRDAALTHARYSRLWRRTASRWTVKDTGSASTRLEPAEAVSREQIRALYTISPAERPVSVMEGDGSR